MNRVSPLCPAEFNPNEVVPSDELDTESGERPNLRRQRAPAEPTAEEVIEHEEHHEPYRAWCPHCIAGRGRSDKHDQRDHQADALPVIGMDYGYLGKELDANPLFCAKDQKHR